MEAGNFSSNEGGALSNQKHDLFDISIYECVLDAAADALSAAAGMDLPGFVARLVDLPADQEEDEREVRIEYREMYDYGEILDIEGCLCVSESVLKGIARRREEDIWVFLDAFLPDYRAARIENELRYQFHLFDAGNAGNDRIIDVADVYSVMRGFGTAPWHLREVSIKGVTAKLFHMEATFEDERFFEKCRELKDGDETAPWNLLYLPFAFA